MSSKIWQEKKSEYTYTRQKEVYTFINSRNMMYYMV